MRHFLSAMLLACLLCVPVAAQQTPPTTQVAVSDPALEQIAELRNGLLDAFNKKDVDKLLTYLHPEVVVTWQNGEVSKGRDGVKDYYNRMMTGPDAIVDTVSAAPEIEGRSLIGDTSISYGHMNDTFKLKNGAEFRLDSRFSAWLVRDNGHWLVRGFHLSANVFNNEIQTAVVRKSVTWTAMIAGVGGLVLGLVAARLFRKRVKG